MRFFIGELLMKFKKIKELAKPYFMIAPAMTGIGFFTVYPVFKLILLSFYETNMLNPAKTRFVGLENYINEFAREAFSRSIINTIVYSFFTIVFIMGFSLVLAVWLGRRRSFSNSAVQVCIFTPHIVSMVSVALIWSQLMDQRFGLLNQFLAFLGLPKSTWLTSSKTALMSVILVATWKAIGYYTLIFIAALQGIPQEIYEAAALDKSGKACTFFRITLPMISPQIFFVLIILTIGSFKVFETIRVMTDGGPSYATTSIAYLIYSEVFQFSRFGYGAATGVVLLVIISLLNVLYFISLSKRVHYQ
jgi:sn-glycerol 3-phosphate transport system permease protein